MGEPEGSRVDGHGIKPTKTKKIEKIVRFLISKTTYMRMAFTNAVLIPCFLRFPNSLKMVFIYVS